MINKIIVEGPDCVGKTTIIKKLLELTNYRYDVFDRGDISNAVYAEIYNRSCNYHRLNWKDTITFVLFRNFSESNWLAGSKNETLNRKEFDLQVKLFEKYACKYSAFYGIITKKIDNMSDIDVALFIKNQVEGINFNLTRNQATNYYKQMVKAGCDKLKLCCEIDGNQVYIKNTPVVDDIWIGCFGKISTLNDVDDITNVHFAYFCGYTIAKTKPNIDEWYERPIDLIYIINSKLSKRPEVETIFNILRTKNNFVFKSRLATKLFCDDYIKALKRAKATIYVGSDLVTFNALTARLYESLYAQNIIFFEESFDADKYFRLCFGENWKHYKELLTFNKNNVYNKIKFVISDKKLSKIILNYQDEFLDKLLRKAKIWK